MRVLATLTLATLVGGCGSTHLVPGFSRKTAPEATLANLQPVNLPQGAAQLPHVGLAELEAIYRQVLTVSQDPATRLQVLHRLADIAMLQGEEKLALTQTRDPLFGEAVHAYQSLLLENPTDPGNDRLLYQLSKAQELNSENRNSLATLEQLAAGYPDSPHYVEARFRLAESYFSAGQYPAAERAYAQVAARDGSNGAYYRNALYMQGWSQFKQGRYHPAINSFSQTLDLLVPSDNQLQTLERGERELAMDCFRVLAVAFSYLDGPQTIADAYQQLGHRSYEHLLYQQLGSLYLGQQRYRDSAETYRAFNRAWPDSEQAHAFQISVIETYEAGGFTELIIAEKQHYVESYAVGGDYWKGNSRAVRQAITANLQQFIEELATYHHALGQSLAQSAAAGDRQNFLRAGDYYSLFVSSFADDPRVPDMLFLLAESRWEAGATVQAIDAYERVAYGFPDYPRAADAGYSAIVAHQALVAADDTGGDRARRASIDSQLRYAQQFAGDGRAPLVLGNAAAALLELSEYKLAIIAAATLTHWRPAPGPEILVPAWLTMAHSHFDLGEYPEAEQAYRHVADGMAVADQRRTDIVERLATSIYRQGEALASVGKHEEAADQFARVIELAPQSSVRLQAQYDAAGMYTKASEFAAANRLLTDFRERFPTHPLAEDVAAKLAHNYQQLQLWQQAARELDGILVNESEPERQRQLLYLAAENYDRAGSKQLAIQRYRSYAHGWPEPYIERFEAMNRLQDLYLQTGQPEKRLFWLRKIIATHGSTKGPGTAGASGDPARALYLAAFASAELADLEYQVYRDIAIRQPLARSLKKKKAAMQRALQAYRQTHDYGVDRFSTLATFRMAEIYRELSVDLLESERPQNIAGLALEQYELMLEEQAFPFEEKAIAIHETNTRRCWGGLYDTWVQQSFSSLAELLPARYAKSETGVSFAREIY